jgi:hypothetical protein
MSESTTPKAFNPFTQNKPSKEERKISKLRQINLELLEAQNELIEKVAICSQALQEKTLTHIEFNKVIQKQKKIIKQRDDKLGLLNLQLTNIEGRYLELLDKQDLKNTSQEELIESMKRVNKNKDKMEREYQQKIEVLNKENRELNKVIQNLKEFSLSECLTCGASNRLVQMKNGNGNKISVCLDCINQSIDDYYGGSP